MYLLLLLNLLVTFLLGTKSIFGVFEIGYDQGTDASNILHENGFHHIEIHKDLSGNDRCITVNYAGSLNKPFKFVE